MRRKSRGKSVVLSGRYEQMFHDFSKQFDRVDELAGRSSSPLLVG